MQKHIFTKFAWYLVTLLLQNEFLEVKTILWKKIDRGSTLSLSSLYECDNYYWLSWVATRSKTNFFDNFNKNLSNHNNNSNYYYYTVTSYSITLPSSFPNSSYSWSIMICHIGRWRKFVKWLNGRKIKTQLFNHNNNVFSGGGGMSFSNGGNTFV